VNVNLIAVLLGCVGLVVGGFGLVAQDRADRSAEAATLQSADAGWPPRVPAAEVAFHDEMVELLTLGAKPRVRAVSPPPPVQATPSEDDTSVRSIRMLRAVGARRPQFVEIEFVDQNRHAYRRLYPIGEPIYAAGDPRGEADRSASETEGYSPRRSRRSGRGYYRRWW
jgi:hypothetical protein